MLKVNDSAIFRLALLAIVIALATRAGVQLARADELAHGLFVMNADGSELKRVQLPAMVCGSPDWFPDGAKIAFDGWKVNEDFSKAHVFVVETAGGEPHDLGAGAMPCWSSDGKQIVFHTYDGGGGIWIMNADGAGRQRICNGYSPRWSPDNSKIACLGAGDGAGVSVFDVVDSSLSLVYRDDQRRFNPGLSWSPDGKRLCFTGGVNNVTELCIINVENPNNEVKVRLSGNLGERAAWSPDGRGILIWKQADSATRLHVVHPDTNAEPVAVNGDIPREGGSDPAWSRDGKKIVFTRRD